MSFDNSKITLCANLDSLYTKPLYPIFMAFKACIALLGNRYSYNKSSYNNSAKFLKFPHLKIFILKFIYLFIFIQLKLPRVQSLLIVGPPTTLYNFATFGYPN